MGIDILQETHGEELTSIRLLAVSRKLTKRSNIRTLGIYLGVEDCKLETILQNNEDDLAEAAYEMLNEWNHGQQNSKEAYTNLWKTLMDPEVNLPHIAKTALSIDSQKKEEGITHKIDISVFKTYNVNVLHSKKTNLYLCKLDASDF